MSTSSTPTQMQKRTLSSPEAHTPQPEVWDPSKPCPWSKEKYERALNYDLPTPTAQALDGFMKASQATAIITALLAGIQAGMIAIIEALPDSNDSALWRTFRFFVYAGVFFDLGATVSSVYITVQGAALPVLARRKAMVMHDLESGPKSGPYRQIHDPEYRMPYNRLNGWNDVPMLEEFGIGRLWRVVAFHMLWNFVLGYICLVMSIILWVCAREMLALIVPVVVIAVGTALPVYGFLRFILPL